MYLRTIATAATTALLLIGCSDQSYVNSPISQKSSAERFSKPDESSQFCIDETVENQATGESYVVTGTIMYEYTSDETMHSLFICPMLEIRNSATKERSYLEQKDYLSAKVVESIITVGQDYVLSGTNGNLTLRLDFNLGKEVTMSGISIYSEPSVIIGEAR